MVPLAWFPGWGDDGRCSPAIIYVWEEVLCAYDWFKQHPDASYIWKHARSPLQKIWGSTFRRVKFSASLLDDGRSMWRKSIAALRERNGHTGTAARREDECAGGRWIEWRRGWGTAIIFVILDLLSALQHLIPPTSATSSSSLLWRLLGPFRLVLFSFLVMCSFCLVLDLLSFFSFSVPCSLSR